MVNWGIMGTARIATKVAAAIRATPNAQVTCVASRSAARAEEWAARHQVPESVEGYQQLLDRADIQAVYIPLPPALHAEWTIKAAERGLHVLCEKPLAMNGSEAEEMADACRRNNVQLMDATMWVHSPRADDMKAECKNAEFGSVQRVTSGFGFQIDDYLLSNPAHAAVDSEGKTTLESAREHELRFRRELGGGALMDLGWYCVGATLWAFEELPLRVFGTGRYVDDVDLNFSGMMWFRNDRVASFDCGFDIARRKWFEVAGQRSSLVCDDFVNPWDSQRPRFWIHDPEGKSHERISTPLIQEQCMIEAMCEIIRRGRLEDRWPQISVDNQRVCSALDEAGRTQQVIDLE